MHKASRVSALVLLLIAAMVMTPAGYAEVWSPDMRLTWDDESDSMPSAIQANDGKIWVFWHSRRSGDYEIFYKTYDASQIHPWSAETRLTFDASIDITPNAIQAADGKIWVVWATNRVSAGNYEIFYKVYDGSVWTPDTRLTFNDSRDELPSIVQGSDGRVWVFWDSRRAGNDDIFYKTTVDNGQSWSTDIGLSISDPTSDDWDPSVTRSMDGRLWLTWVKRDDVYYSFFDGSSWSSPTIITGGGLDNWHPAIMQADDGKIWIVWDVGKVDPPVQTDIYYSFFDGSSWSSPTRLTTHPAEDTGPSIIQDNQATIWIFWSSDRGNDDYKPHDLFYRTTSLPPTHDVEIFSVQPNATTVYLPEYVSIEVVVRNLGANNETNVEVKCYVNTTLTGSRVLNLSAGQLYPLYFLWSTSSFPFSNYTLSATASQVPEEANIDNNTYIDGIVEVRALIAPLAAFNYSPSYPETSEIITFNASSSKPGSGTVTTYAWDFDDGNITTLSNPIITHAYSIPATRRVKLTVTNSKGLNDTTSKNVIVGIHDIALLGGSNHDKTPWSQDIVYYVDVANEGDMEETFSIIISFGDVYVGMETVTLSPGTAVYNVGILCSTSEVPPGTYSVKAEALAVQGERDLSDNVKDLGSLWLYVNHDGLLLFTGSYGSMLGSTNWNQNCDFNNDGIVDALDLAVLGKNYGNTNP